MADANTNRKNHIFPLYLKADSVALTEAATGSLDVTTSYITFTADVSTNAGNVGLILPDGTIPGQIMVLNTVTADAGDFFTITITSALDANHDQIVLNADDEQATLLWNGEAWIVLSLDGATIS
jgi:hypothetical protein